MPHFTWHLPALFPPLAVALRMHLLRSAILVCAVVSLAWPGRARAQLGCLETEDLRLVYLEGPQSYLVPHVASCFQNSIRFQRELFGYEPSERVTVILNDFADYGNAGAGAVPRNGLSVMIAPMNYAYETYPSNERMNTLMNHELVHIANFDKAAGRDRFFRGLFRGKVDETSAHPETILYAYLTAPRTAAPRWFHEGIAVFVETWMAGGIGRAQGSFDEMVFRSMVRDGSRFYDPLGLVAEGTSVDFQVELNSYLYGTRFVSYLALTYSPDSVIDWYARSGGSKAYYSSQFKRVFGVSLADAWADWVAWEQGFQAENLATIREYPPTAASDISARALGSISRPYYDPDTRMIYAGLNYPGIVAHIAAISVDDGSVRPLVDVKGPMMYTVTSLAYDPGAKRLFYTTDNGAFRDLVELDPATGDTRRLLEDARIGDLVFDASDQALWGVRHDSGFSTLVRIPAPYSEWNQIRTWEYGQTLYDLDVSADGSLLAASLGEIDGSHAVHVMQTADLKAGSLTTVTSFDFGTTIGSNFVFGDGHDLYGTSYYTGVSNVFRYNASADSLEALSNCETGFFRPIPVSEDELIVFRYTGAGFVPAWIRAEILEDINPVTLLGARIVERHPAVTEWRVGSPADVPLNSLTTFDGDYRALARLELESVYPVVEGYKDYPAYGLHLDLSDPISLHRFDAGLSYTPNSDLDEDERLHGRLGYERYDWRASFQWNGADFYDLVGPTKTSRRGYSGSLGYSRSLIYDSPRNMEISGDISFHGNLERLPDYQNVSASFEELLTGSLRLSYRNMRFSLGAVDYEKGVKWSLRAANNHVNGRSFPNGIATVDLGTQALMSHSSIWLRLAGGYAPTERSEPFSNFFFGGFGNNYVDHREPKRYREWYAFPGLELNEIGGTNFAKAVVDWNLPPVRFRRLGTPGLYASWARTSLFTSGLVTNVDDGDLRNELLNVGAQLDVRLSLLSHLDMTASVGYAWSFQEGRKSRNEFMLSFKIL